MDLFYNVIAKDYGFVEMKLSENFFGIGGSRKFRNLGYGVPKVAHLIERSPRRKLVDAPVMVERPDDEGHSKRTCIKAPTFECELWLPFICRQGKIGMTR